MSMFFGLKAKDSGLKSSTSSSNDLSAASNRGKITERSKVVSESDDPLAFRPSEGSNIKVENLTIRLHDEARILNGLISASRKQATGSIYSAVVDLGKTGTLGIGVKDLTDGILAVSLLKRENGQPGAGEEAGMST